MLPNPSVKASFPFSDIFHGKILVNTVGVEVVWWVFGEELGPFLLGFSLLIFQNAYISLTTVTVTMPLGLTASA